MSVDIEELRRRFVGKEVRITHTGTNLLRDKYGTCRDFYAIEGGRIDIELTSGDRHDFIPDTLTDRSVEGVFGWGPGRRRVVELV